MYLFSFVHTHIGIKEERYNTIQYIRKLRRYKLAIKHALNITQSQFGSFPHENDRVKYVETIQSSKISVLLRALL